MLSIISCDKPFEIDSISHGDITIDNSDGKVHVAVRILRVATLAEYRVQCEKAGYKFNELYNHGPYYYEAQFLD